MVRSCCHVFSHADRIRNDEILLRGERETERQKDTRREKRKEQKQNVTRGWKRAKSHSASWILAVIRMLCVYTSVCVYVRYGSEMRYRMFYS